MLGQNLSKPKLWALPQGVLIIVPEDTYLTRSLDFDICHIQSQSK